ncbi:MAG: helix-turn-helix transcriptional regulator, partial [Thermoleophilia bacterium]|nr:helix-turn-helix transcriptional regulator [Thermoleophilia bacterium]
SRRVHDANLRLVAAVRVEQPHARLTILDAVAEELWVSGLDDDASAAILAESATTLTRTERRLLQQQACGNPLALMELPATWRGDGTPAKLTLSARLERDFGGRAAELPAVTRDLLLVAAVDDGRHLDEIVQAVTMLSGRGCDRTDLVPACELGLVSERVDLVEFRHPLVRSGILQAENVTRRQSAHAALASVIDEPFRQAWHRAQAIIGPDDGIADQLEMTAEESLRRGAVMTAINSLERAAELTTNSSRRGHRLLKAAEHAFGLGRGDLVDRLVNEAATTDLSELDWARMQWLREIFSDGVPGDAPRVLELCEMAARSAAANDHDLALNLLLGAALRCWWADTGPAARAYVVAVVDRVFREDDPRAITVLAVAEPVLRAAQVTDALARLPVGDVSDVDVLRLLGMAAHAIGDSPRSDEYLAAAEAQLRAQHRLGVLVHALSMHVIVSLELGDWEKAIASSDEVVQLAEETGQAIWTTGTLVCEAISQALRGDPDRALELVAQVELTAYRNRLNDLLSCAQLARGLAMLDLDRPDEAYEALRRALDPADPTYHQRESFGAVMFLAEAASLCARVPEARLMLGRLRDVAEVTPVPVLRVQLDYAEAVLAEDDEAEELFLRGLARDLERWPWVRARLELAYGRWLCRQERGPQAIPLLTSARDTLGRIGAVHWRRAAEAELASRSIMGAW